MTDDLVESSTNFDLENVRPFLLRIAPLITSGFGDHEIDQVLGLVKSMKHDDEEEIAFTIVHRGRRSAFLIHVFMDDIDSPDIAFFGPPDLARQIDAEMDKFWEEIGTQDSP